MNYKGIILAGGHGTRLKPLTSTLSKQILPVYDKPMIYYPLSVLMEAKINEILVISSPRDIHHYELLLGDGSQLGMNISYEIQKEPNGIAEAFIIGSDFIGNSNVALILGDNIFYGHNFRNNLSNALMKKEGATIFGYHVNNPQRFGVVEFDESKNVISIEEKPTNPKSNFAVTGLYFYDNSVKDIAQGIKPSNRGELEITDINNEYKKQKKLCVELLGRGFAWLDTGTHDSLLDAGKFIQTIEKRQGLKVACIEEIAYNNKWIDKLSLRKISDEYKNTEYGKYLLEILE